MNKLIRSLERIGTPIEFFKHKKEIIEALKEKCKDKEVKE